MFAPDATENHAGLLSEIKILLVEDDKGDAEIIEKSLLEGRGPRYNLTRAENLEEALRCLRQTPLDIILLDLFLPDAEGLTTFLKIRQEKAETPIIVLTGLDDEGLAYKTVEQGAQDYLVKQNINGAALIRSIRYALQRQTLVNELRALSLRDGLTGLYNRRGFMFLAQQELNKAGRRKDEVLILLVADMDNMKWINDHLGHQEGDHALIDFASILKKTFRLSDVLGRIGGDEFAVLAVDHVDNHPTNMITRLRKMTDHHKQEALRAYELMFSAGIIQYDPTQSSNIHDVLHRADLVMYREKHSKKASSLSRTITISDV